MKKLHELPTAPTGHNSQDRVLQAFIERVENLIEERAGLNSDIRDVMAEVKANGFDVRTVREMIKLRTLDRSELQRREEVRDAYLRGLDLVS